MKRNLPQSPTAPATSGQRGWKVKNWCAATDTSPANAYRLLAAGTIEGRKLGASRIIITPPDEFLRKLPR